MHIARALPRCIRCRMHLEHCFCDEIPRLAAATRVVLVMHSREQIKVSNTGRLLLAALPDCRLAVHGRPDAAPVRLDGALDPARQTYLLFPSDDAPPLSRAELEADGRAVTLVVPDGTWRQAKKFPRRIPALAELPRRCLPAGPPSRYRIRVAPHPGQLSTCEAVSRALGIIEGHELQARLDALLDTLVERTLLSRGRDYAAPGAPSVGQGNTVS